MAFGKILNDLSRVGGPLADAIVTTSPDVTVSTNLGGFVNQRGVFARTAQADTFRDASIASPLKWAKGPNGQHVELGSQSTTCSRCSPLRGLRPRCSANA